MKRYHLLKDFGLWKQTLARKFERTDGISQEQGREVRELLALRTQLYTLDEIEMMVKAAVYHATDAAVLDNPQEARFPVDVVNARNAEARIGEVLAKIKALRAEEGDGHAR